MARVIRAERTTGAVLPREIFDAKHSASQIVQRAQTDAAALRDAARAEGLQAGRAEGRARAAAELFELAGARARALTEAEKDLTVAALRIASHLVADALAERPERIAGMLVPLLKSVRRARRIVVHTHPDDAATLTPLVALLTTRLDLEGTLRLAADPALARGDCLVESDIGDLDARIATRLTDLGKALGVEIP